MLKRVHIKGFKSLDDLEVRLSPVSVFLGANASGKSNFLDALQLLSRLSVSATLQDAFAPPYRGTPFESFRFGEGGIEGRADRDKPAFSIEADLELSEESVAAVNRRIREMSPPSDLPGDVPGDMRRVAEDGAGGFSSFSAGGVRERRLRYRLEVEMTPKTGFLRVADEHLCALNAAGEPAGDCGPFIERQDGKIHLRFEGREHSAHYDRYLDHTILSMPHYPPHHPHLAAARYELENWRFFYFEPRERMRVVNPVKEVRCLGQMGENLAAYLNTLRAEKPRSFETIGKALSVMVPGVTGVDLKVNQCGEAELRIKENGAVIPAGVASEGTLRMLGLLALTRGSDSPTLVGLEEPETGVHPARVDLIAEFLWTKEFLGISQFLVTTHSPILADRLPEDYLFAVHRPDGKTQITPYRNWGVLGRPLLRKSGVHERPREEDDQEEEIPDSERSSVFDRLMRGDFDA